MKTYYSPLVGFLALLLSVTFSTTPLSAADPVPGKYVGSTGSIGQISLRVNRRGNRISRLHVSVFASGRDDFGYFTSNYLLRSRTDNRSFRLSRSGRFVARGTDRYDVRYRINGTLRGKRRFRGTASLSWYDPYAFYTYDPYYGYDIPVGELVAGSRSYTARR